METRCLICESTLVVTKAQAQACSLLLGTLDGFLDGCSKMHTQSGAPSIGDTVQRGFERLTRAVESATSGCAQGWEFAQDVQHYHFGEFECLCLRCGARFDQQPSDTLTPQPGDPPTARPAPGSTDDPQVRP